MPDTFYQANSGAEIEAALREIFGEIKKGATSGTVIAAQTTGKGKGSIINHAASYPKNIWRYRPYMDRIFIYILVLNTKYAQNVRDNTVDNSGRIILDVYNPSYDQKKQVVNRLLLMITTILY